MITVNNKKYFHISEVAKMVGVHYQTLHRWIKYGKIQDSDRDRNNSRIFDEPAIKKIKARVEKITPASHKLQGSLFSQGRRR